MQMMTPSFDNDLVSLQTQMPTPHVYKPSLVNRRVACTCLFISAVLGLFAGATILSGRFLLNGKIPMAPGAGFAFGEYLLRTDQCTVGGADGTIVQRVFEPRTNIENVMHAELLLQQMEKLAQAGDGGKRRRLTPKMVGRGYLEWLVRSDEPAFNFTLGGARKAAIEIANRFNASCLCYAYMGVPENIVLLRTPPSAYEVLYEPSIVADSPKSTIVAYDDRHYLFALLRNAMEVRLARSGDPAAITSGSAALSHLSVGKSFITSSAGMVASITESAGIRRSMYAEPHYPCLKFCVSLFDEGPQKINEREL
jgi:hypothetical protein